MGEERERPTVRAYSMCQSETHVSRGAKKKLPLFSAHLFPASGHAINTVVHSTKRQPTCYKEAFCTHIYIPFDTRTKKDIPMCDKCVSLPFLPEHFLVATYFHPVAKRFFSTCVCLCRRKRGLLQVKPLSTFV